MSSLPPVDAEKTDKPWYKKLGSGALATGKGLMWTAGGAVGLALLPAAVAMGGVVAAVEGAASLTGGAYKGMRRQFYGRSTSAEQNLNNQLAIGLATETLTALTRDNSEFSKKMLDVLHQVDVKELTPAADFIDRFEAIRAGDPANAATLPLAGQFKEGTESSAIAKVRASLTRAYEQVPSPTEDTALDAAKANYSRRLERILNRFQQGKIADPRVAAKLLHDARCTLEAELDIYKEQFLASMKVKNESLFNNAIALTKGEDADLSAEARDDAQMLLDSLQEAGLIAEPRDATSDVAVVEGDESLMEVNGEPLTTPEATVEQESNKEEIVRQLETLKENERRRLERETSAHTETVKKELADVAANFYFNMQRQTAAFAIINQQTELRSEIQEQLIQLSKAQGSGAKAALDTRPDINQIDMVKSLDNLARENGNQLEVAGGYGRMNYDPDKGQCDVNLKKLNDRGQQEAINQQAALIALKHDSITFTAEATKGGEYTIVDNKRVAEIALKQAIAIKTTAGLDQAKSKIKVQIGVDKKGAPQYSEPMTADEVLEKYQANLKKNQLIEGKTAKDSWSTIRKDSDGVSDQLRDPNFKTRPLELSGWQEEAFKYHKKSIDDELIARQQPMPETPQRAAVSGGR